MLFYGNAFESVPPGSPAQSKTTFINIAITFAIVTYPEMFAGIVVSSATFSASFADILEFFVFGQKMFLISIAVHFRSLVLI
jgi:type IV secretory pathway VirB3-like protein